MDTALQLAIPICRIALGTRGRIIDQFGTRLVVGPSKEAGGIAVTLAVPGLAKILTGTQKILPESGVD